ncbi:MAG: hypothetical protein IKN53_03365 [Oscillibacter sp.]|nr:hypothetical protein [Oscillibacter sp.]
MKKALLIVGVVCLVVAAAFLIFAALSLSAYHHVMDGSPELYAKLQQRAVVFGALGAVSALLGIACLVARAKM